MNKVRSLVNDSSGRQFLILAVVTLATALTGGSSQATMPALVLLRPVLALALVTTLILPAQRDWRGLRAPTTLLAVFALAMALQLAPLPARWWLALPGHARYAFAVQASSASALSSSLAPDLTLNSLFALMPATIAIVTFAAMHAAHRRATAWLVVGVVALTLVVAIGQISGGLILYPGQQDYVSGLLANRNHQAVLLASVLPVLAVLIRSASGRQGKATPVLLGALAVVILPMVLLTGSRQGLVLTIFALLGAVALLPLRTARAGSHRRLVKLALPAFLLGVTAILIVVALKTDRAVSIERLVNGGGVESDTRGLNWPTIVMMARAFFPTGIGFGAFDPVFRGFEPDSVLSPFYLNHAHNDFLELVATGGLIGVLLILAAIGFVIQRAFAMFGRDASISREAKFIDRAGLMMVTLYLGASAVDYPLRTPIVSLVVMVAVCWMAAPPVPAKLRLGKSRREPVSRTAGGAWP